MSVTQAGEVWLVMSQCAPAMATVLDAVSVTVYTKPQDVKIVSRDGWVLTAILNV